MTRNSTIARHWACALLGLGAAWAAAAANRPYPATAAPSNTTLQACIDAADGGDTIVLVSDGRETCRGDPCALARELAATHG